MIDFAGKVVLVTGAASGMGAATAREFSAAGAKVLKDDAVEYARRLGVRIAGHAGANDGSSGSPPGHCTGVQ